MKTTFVLHVNHLDFQKQVQQLEELADSLTNTALIMPELWLLCQNKAQYREVEILFTRFSTVQVLICETVWTDFVSHKANFLSLVATEQPEMILFTGDQFGKELAARVNATMKKDIYFNVKQIQRITENAIQIQQELFGSQLLGISDLQKMPIVLVLAATYNQNKSIQTKQVKPKVVEIREFEPKSSIKKIRVLKKYTQQSIDLVASPFIVAIGRGVQSEIGAQEAKEFASRYHGEVGGTRAATTNGWLSHDRLIGVSGKSSHADICLTLGVSGLPAFTKGIENCKKIIAVNKDSEALIFNNCDIGFVCESQEFIEKLLERREKGDG
ncbi:FAD-binding protein [Carnobacterium gallinarum]|uniref:FAD-binding protein n=1 Tax=Carnobacterium gallinarum TaxID=2749 RepID=UPI0006918560|nr:FAD-binding protein [Carnobacterium gallinarum]